MSLSCTEQESNQRSRLGDVLTAKPIVSALINHLIYPGFEPPSPRPPPGPYRGTGGGRFLGRCPCAYYFAAVLISGFRLLPFFRPAPEGVHRGGRLKAGVICWTKFEAPIGFAVSASPMSASFRPFLAETRKGLYHTHAEINRNLKSWVVFSKQQSNKKTDTRRCPFFY